MFGSQSLNVDIVQHHHANMDSFPFRYGIHFSRTTSIKIFNCKNYKWQVNGQKFEVEASFVGNNDQIENGLFILAVTDFPNPRVVTVMRNDVETEFYLSKLIKSLRESGNITTNDLMRWHPLYLSGEANTFEKLAKLYSAKSNVDGSAEINALIAEAKNEAKLEYENLLKQKEHEISRLKLEKEKAELAARETFEIYEVAEQELSETKQKLSRVEIEEERIRGIARIAAEGLNERDNIITKQKTEIAEKEAQIEEFKNRLVNLVQQHPQYDGSDVELSTVGCLEKVEKRTRTKANGDSVNCVYLHFKGGLPERKMDEVFDPQDIIFEKAKKFIGREVVTVTWRPEIFRATHWFRDIFLWDMDAPTETLNYEQQDAPKIDVGTYLNCPFEEKDECKNLGGKWDPKNKKWYVPQGVDVSVFRKWL